MSILQKHWRTLTEIAGILFLTLDLNGFGKYFRASFEAQIAMFPNMVDDFIFKVLINIRIKHMAGNFPAGGGGYLIFVAEKPIAGAMQIKIRRKP